MRRLALLLVPVLAATACGDPDAAVQQDPKGSLRDAFHALGDYEGYEVRLGLEADDVTVGFLVESGDMSAAEADLWFGFSLLVRTEGDGLDGNVEYVFSVDEVDLVEVRVLDEMDLYGRIDLPGLLALSDTADEAAELADFLAEAKAAGFGEVATALEAGDWIHVTGIQQMMNMYEGMLRGMAGMGLGDLEQLGEQVMDDLVVLLGRFLDEGVEVTHVGREDAGSRVRAAADGDAIRALLSDLVEVFVQASLDAGMGDLFGEADRDGVMRELEEHLAHALEEGIPSDLTVSVDAWIDGGRLTKVAFDVAQFPQTADLGELLVVVELAELSGAVEAPDDAVELDLFRLFGGLMGFGLDASFDAARAG